MRPLKEILQERHDDPNDPFSFGTDSKRKRDGDRVMCHRCGGLGTVAPESLSILEERVMRRRAAHERSE